MNNVSLIGRLCADPELKYIPGSGNAVANFTLAVDRGMSKEKKKEAEANNQQTADFPRVTVWGKQAENCANYLAKGRLVAISGSIRTSSSRDDEGNMSYYTDVNAFRVEFLEWGDKEDSQEKGNLDDDLGDIPF